MNESIQSRLYKRLEQEPEQRAIAFYNKHGEYTWLTVEAFYNRANGLAAQLAGYGLRKGDVGIYVMPSGEFPAALIVASLLLGAVPLLVAPPTLHGQAAYSSLAEILSGIVDKTGPRVVVASDELVFRREELEKKHPHTRFIFGEDELAAAAPVEFKLETPTSTEVAAMQLTSGTTGFPRVCVWEQKSVLAALDGMAAAMKLGEDDVCLNWTPLYHDMGLVNNFLFCLINRAPLVMLNPVDFVKRPALWLRSLADTGATITWSPNFGFAITAQRVRDEEIKGVRLDGVRGFWNAAERIHLETFRAFHKRFEPYGVRLEALKTNFGCAENIGGATFSEAEGMFVYEQIDPVLMQDEGIAQSIDKLEDEAQGVSVVSAGRAYPGMRINILSDNGDFLPDGHIGAVALETPSRMLGYLDDAEATREAIRDNLLLTGDMGYLRDGELFWVGRVRERIAIRGKKLDPSDFEYVLLKVSGLRHGNFAAFGVDDSEQGTQRIVIVAEARDDTSRTPEEISEDIRSQTLLSLGVTISDVVLVQMGTLTKTSSGKRRHRYFRELYQSGELKDFEWRPQ
jgi:acyl-CoA synthetase (AMP-forming)/AMP-acid ligase II